jgi:hypothetical protein
MKRGVGVPSPVTSISAASVLKSPRYVHTMFVSHVDKLKTHLVTSSVGLRSVGERVRRFMKPFGIMNTFVWG